MRKTAEERFWVKVDKDGPIPPSNPELGPCWLWVAGRTPPGYGRFHFRDRGSYAHIFAFEMATGAFVPQGLELDHLCRNRACVRWTHLEAVTHTVNAQRGEVGKYQQGRTHCPHGHPINEANARIDRKGHRVCRPCQKKRNAANYLKSRIARERR